MHPAEPLRFVFEKRKENSTETPPHRTGDIKATFLKVIYHSLTKREDADVEPHEGPQRRPSATIGHTEVSWMYVFPISCLD